MENNDILNTLEGLSASVQTGGDTYMGDDGLLLCSRCHTPRQVKVEVFGVERTVNCICRCMEEEQNRKDEWQRRYERMERIKRFRAAGFSDRELEGCTFDADDGSTPQIRKAMEAYVKNFPELRKDGKGLLLYGNVGTGKSFYAACIVNALIDRGYPCLMTNFSRLANQIFDAEDKQEYIDGLTRYSLVAIDDLGVERNTAYMTENVTTIIDSLYRARVPLIVTSNYTPKDLTEATEIQKARVYDRLLERTLPVKVDGPSRRKQIGRSDYHSMRTLLGLE